MKTEEETPKKGSDLRHKSQERGLSEKRKLWSKVDKSHRTGGEKSLLV